VGEEVTGGLVFRREGQAVHPAPGQAADRRQALDARGDALGREVVLDVAHVVLHGGALPQAFRGD
jgi:hypothetical protein